MNVEHQVDLAVVVEDHCVVVAEVTLTRRRVLLEAHPVVVDAHQEVHLRRRNGREIDF